MALNQDHKPRMRVPMSFPSQTTSHTCIQCDKSFLLETDLRRHQRKHPGGEKPFLCTECNKRFSQMGHLKRHERIHTGEKRFKCKECAKAFTQDVGLKIHTRMHTGEKPFTCEQCGKSFIQAFNLRRHQKSCDKMSNKMGTSPMLNTNDAKQGVSKGKTEKSKVPESLNIEPSESLNIEPSESLNIEPSESLNIEPSDSLNIEPSSESLPGRKEAQDTTPNKIPSKYLLQAISPPKDGRHQNEKSKISEHNFQSDVFAMKLIEEGGIFEPTCKETKVPEIQQTDSVTLQCSNSSILLDKSSALTNLGLTKLEGQVMANSEENVKIHRKGANEKPPNHEQSKSVRRGFVSKPDKGVEERRQQLICKMCGKSFSTEHILEYYMHEIFHKKERHIECSECGKKFATPTNLKRHQMIHTGEKPYGCEQCGKTFSQNVSLIEHKRIHTGERPHLCVECGQSFTAYPNFKAHQEIHRKKRPLRKEIQKSRCI